MNSKLWAVTKKVLTVLAYIAFSFTAVGCSESSGNASKREVEICYSHGFQKRAAYLQDLVEAAAFYFKKPDILNINLDLTLAVLSPEDWARRTKFPYGISHISLEPPTVFLPATTKNILTQGILEMKNQVSDKFLRDLQNLGYSFEEAVTVFADLISIHEIGHLFAFTYDIHPKELWLNEFIATYLAYAFLKERRPELAKLWEIMCDILAESSEHKHTTLTDFERLYIGVGNRNYGWYQGKFQQIVKKVYNSFGISFIHTLKQSLIENPYPPEEDPFRLLELEAISIEFSGWAKDSTGDLN